MQTTTYLSDLPIVGQRIAEPGSADVAGSVYVHSVILDPNNVDEKAWADYDLGGHFARLHAKVGMLSDDLDQTLAWEVFANGQSIKRGTVGLYKPVEIDVDITGVQRLRITSALTGHFDIGGGPDKLKLAFADATLSVDLHNPPPPSPAS